MPTYKDAEGRKLKIHPACDAIPYGSDDDLQELAARIKVVGQKRPILTYQGWIVNGKRRLRACEIAEITPQFEEIAVAESDERTLEQIITDVVQDEDLHRRQLTVSEKGACALKLAEGLGISHTKAAKMAGTHRQAVHKAKKLRDKEGPAALEDAVKGKRKLFGKKKPDVPEKVETDPAVLLRQKSAQMLPEIAKFRRNVSQLLEAAYDWDAITLNERKPLETSLKSLHELVDRLAQGK